MMREREFRSAKHSHSETEATQICRISVKRLLRILTTRERGHELMCRAADSKLGAAVLLTIWLVGHVVFVASALTGRVYFDRNSDDFLHWLEFGMFGFSLVFVDGVFLRGLMCERAAERKRNASARRAFAGSRIEEMP